MQLGYAVEYLMTLSGPGGNRLCYGGLSQTIVPLFPPNTSITLEGVPGFGDFLNIVFFSSAGPAMVPLAFAGEAFYYGSRQYSGILASWFVANDVSFFVPVSHQWPATATINNISPLNQYYEGYAFALTFRTEDDYALALEALNRMGTSSKLEQLAAECRGFLSGLAGKIIC